MIRFHSKIIGLHSNAAISICICPNEELDICRLKRLRFLGNCLFNSIDFQGVPGSFTDRLSHRVQLPQFQSIPIISVYSRQIKREKCDSIFQGRP
jgi:hypothetical protein